MVCVNSDAQTGGSAFPTLWGTPWDAHWGYPYKCINGP